MNNRLLNKKIIMITILTILFTNTSFSTNLAEEKSLTPKDRTLWSKSSSSKEKSKNNNFNKGSKSSSKEECKDCYIKLPEKKSKKIENHKKSSITYNDLDKNSYDYDLALADTFKTNIDVEKDKKKLVSLDRKNSPTRVTVLPLRFSFAKCKKCFDGSSMSFAIFDFLGV